MALSSLNGESRQHFKAENSQKKTGRNVEFSTSTRPLNKNRPHAHGALAAPNRGRGSRQHQQVARGGPHPSTARIFIGSIRAATATTTTPVIFSARRATRHRSTATAQPIHPAEASEAAAAGATHGVPCTDRPIDVDELRRLFPARVGPRLRRHRAHPRPPRLLLLSRRPRGGRTQARRRRARRPRQAAVPKGAGGGVAAGAGVPAERAAGGREARQGGRGWRAVPAQGGPRGARRLRGPPPRAPRHVRLLPRRPGRRRGDQARRLGHRRRVRAHLRGQGRGLDARRRRPLEDVRGGLQADSSHEELRGRQLIAKKIIQMIDPIYHACTQGCNYSICLN